MQQKGTTWTQARELAGVLAWRHLSLEEESGGDAP
jgi:hypothetical protein